MAASTRVLIELFVLVRRAGALWIVHPAHPGNALSWNIPHQPGISPNQAVINDLLRVFGGSFDPSTSIVHSTSWRYLRAESRDEPDGIVLTYAAILQPEQIDALIQRDDLKVDRFEWAALSMGGNLNPPATITPANVVIHALEHYALLAQRDPAVRRVLNEDWKEFLAGLEIRPAGERD